MAALGLSGIDNTLVSLKYFKHGYDLFSKLLVKIIVIYIFGIINRLFCY